MKHSGRRTQSELHLQSQIIANMGEGVYLIRSADGIIVYCNPKFEKMFGYEPDEMVGQHVSIVNAPDQGDPQETVRAIVTQLQTRGYWNGELLNIKKDGTTFWSYASVSSFEHHEHGEVWVSVHTDITERIQRETEFSRIKNMPRALIMVAKIEGTIVRISAGSMGLLGYTEDEMVGKPYWDFIHPDDFPASKAASAGLAGRQDVLYFENRYRHKAGHYITLAWSASIDSQNGYIYAVGQDVTAGKEAGQALVQANADLEMRVAERTRELSAVNDQLVREIEEKEQVEAELRKNEKLYRDLYDSMPVAYFTSGKFGSFSSANRAATELTGYPLAELLKISILDIYADTPSGKPKVKRIIEQIKLGAKIQAEELQILRADGEIRWVSLSIEYVPDKDLRHAVMVDISERKQIEEEVERMASIVKYSSDFIGISDIQGHALFLNDAGRKLVGIEDDDQFHGTMMLDFFPDDDRLLLEKEILPTLMDIGRWVGEVHFRHFGTGKKIPVYFDIFRIDHPTTGEPINFATVTRDITEQKAQRKALLENETRLAEAQRIAHLGHWDWNLLTDDLYWSDEIYHIYGLQPQEFRPSYPAFIETVHPDDREHVKSAVANALAGEAYSIDHRIVRKDGSLRHVHEEGQVTFDKNGKPVRMLGIVQDITEGKHAQEVMRRSLAEKEVLLKEIHHRVKNNLQIISSLLYLQSEGIEDEAIINLLNESRSRVQAMALLHENLYNSADLAAIDTRAYVTKLTAYLSQTYNGSGRGIELLTKVDDLHLDIDTAIPLGLIINELVSNAFKYAYPEGSAEGKSIRIELISRGSNRARLSVSDDGVGLKESDEMKGSLGLELVHNLADQLDGELTINRLHGTEFHIEFSIKPG